jgi:prepilin signal peptidase PulO-like enzyme (type II secretory pathway)
MGFVRREDYLVQKETEKAYICALFPSLAASVRYDRGMLVDFPLWYQYAFVGVFGLIIGSFLNVFIYRFHTGKSLNGRSHCLSCGTGLSVLELIPLVSYLGQRGRCRTCGSYIPVRYLVVEVLTASLFVLSFLVASDIPELILFLVVSSVMVLILVYDIRHLIIPDSLTVTLTIIAALWYGFLFYEGVPIFSLLVGVGAALGGAGFFYLLWFVSKGQWLGFGDVKLAIPLGLLVGPNLVFSMVVFSFWVGAIISLALIGIQSLQRGKLRLQNRGGRLTMKSVVPFAPFMILGCLIVLFTKLNVLSLFSFL